MAETILLDCKMLRAACQEKNITNPGSLAEFLRIHQSLAEVLWENETVRIPIKRLHGLALCLKQNPFDFSVNEEEMDILRLIANKLDDLQKLNQEIERNTRGRRIIGL